jgi:hypothetical protein
VLSIVILLIACSLFYGILYVGSVTAAGKTDYMDFFAGSKPFGKPLDEWAKSYWQWSLTIPYEIPKDETGLDKCIVGHDPQGRMQFLLNSYEKTYATKCTISSQKPILIPLLIGECDSSIVDDPRVKTGRIEDLWECAKDVDEEFYLWDVILDDKVLFRKSGTSEVNPELKEKILVRNSSPFMLNFSAANLYDVPEGSYRAVVDGYYLIIKPLLPGEHTLKYKITHKVDPTGPLPSFVNGDVTYHLTVN